MNILLWVLQGLAALMYGASGVMKIFMFDEISKDVRSFDALPRKVWTALGVLELVCVAGLLAGAIPASTFPAARYVTAIAASILAIESLLFIRVHMKYRETVPIIMCTVLGLLMAFIAYGRWAL